MTFHLAPPTGEIFQSLSEISQHLLDGLAQHLVVHGPQRMNPTDFDDV